MGKKDKGSILIVDDDREVSKSLSAWLKTEGFITHTAANSCEAIRVVKNKGIDLAILDYRMSKEDGIALSRRLNEIDEHLRTVILTGFPSYESAVCAIKSGVFDYLSKSMPNDIILKSIQKGVEESKAGRIVKRESVGKRPIKMVLFCDHSLIIERLENICEKTREFKLIASYPEIEYLKVKNISQEIDIALICAGCYLKTFKDSYEVFPELYRNFPGIKPVIINENFSDNEKVELLKLGVRGFSSRQLNSNALEKALSRVNKGEIWVSRRVTSLSLKEMMDYNSCHRPKTEISGLTEREIDILKTMALGLKNKEIADKLFISEKTVKTHINRIFKKLGVSNRARAILAALEKKVFTVLDSQSS